MDSREVLVIITGVNKALALAKSVEEGINHMWTVSGIQVRSFLVHLAGASCVLVA